MADFMTTLQPGVGAGTEAGARYLPASPDRVLWGRLPRRSEVAAATIEAGERGAEDGPHVVTGPIARGADARWGGWLPTAEGQAPLVSFPLAPFLGIMGVATDTGDRAHPVPPGAHGGNIDFKHLVEGATLFIPVQVLAALAHVGEPQLALACLSVATDFEMTQVVDLVTGVHARIRVADFGAVRHG